MAHFTPGLAHFTPWVVQFPPWLISPRATLQIIPIASVSKPACTDNTHNLSV